MKKGLWGMAMCFHLACAAQHGLHARFIASAIVQGQNPELWGLLAYPAAFSDTSGTMAGFSGEKKFMSPLNVYLAGCSGHLLQAYMSLCLEQEGTQDFSRQRISMGAGKKIAGALQLGVRLAYQFNRASGYRTSGGMSAGLGVFLKCSERISLAIQGDQLNGFFTENAIMPYRIMAAAGYTFSGVFGMSMDVMQEEGRVPDFTFGFTYRFHPLFLSRVAFSSGSDIFFFSLGFLLHDIHFELGTSLHQALGPSTSLHLYYRFQKTTS